MPACRLHSDEGPPAYGRALELREPRGSRRHSIDKPTLNFPKVIDRKNSIVNKHAKGVEFLMKKNKVEVIAGYATIKGPGKVEVKDRKEPRFWRRRTS